MAARTMLRSRFTYWAMTCGWLTAALAGFAVMINRDVTPGETADAPGAYPREALGPAAADRPTLMMFAHPRCPCTSASLSELRQVLQTCPGAADLRIYFRTPATESADWTQTALWKEAASLCGVTLVADPDGAVARHCGVRTSGHVLLYGTDGKLRFSGGITAARGHAGETSGRSAVVAILSDGSDVGRRSETFGCPLFDKEMCRKEETCCPP
ncbi:MAG TPA: hypothetical protein VG125_11495 [Pirellulales bacterium]|nr:hypothetical protein [Pirellulales bacterium]